MIRSWFKRFIRWFSRDRPDSTFFERKREKISHVFSPPLNISMLRKVHCRRPRIFAKENRNGSAINYSRRKSSFIAIDLNEEKNQFFRYHSSRNLNSTSDNSSLNSETSSNDRSNEKTWKLQIQDDLNKDGSRHNVIHKDSAEIIRQRREMKRSKRSEEKKRRIAEKVSNANQRWKKYSNIDYELVLFISRYFDQLPLCSNCRKYFITHRTDFLSENPRASIDYAAEDAMKLVAKKSLTLKQIAKTKLIQDYDKQTELMFHLCDSCLEKCEEIRNELKQRNIARKIFNETSPNNRIENEEENPPDLHQMYVSNLLRYHQLKLEHSYRKTQSFLSNQVEQSFCPLMINSQEENEDFQTSIDEMKYHCLEALQLQYPGYSLSFPYLPLSDPEHLSFRHDHNTREKSTHDDRLTIDTCHGLVEYCDAPLDDFIRGLQVLKCLSTYNKCDS